MLESREWKYTISTRYNIYNIYISTCCLRCKSARCKNALLWRKCPMSRCKNALLWRKCPMSCCKNALCCISAPCNVAKVPYLMLQKCPSIFLFLSLLSYFPATSLLSSFFLLKDSTQRISGKGLVPG